MNIRSAERRLPQNAFLAKSDADARAQRAFWRGMIFGVASAWVGILIWWVLLA